MIVIHGLSALAWLRTPPVVRESALDIERAVAPVPVGAGLDPRRFMGRCTNSPETDAVRSRLLTELKGVPLPVHVATTNRSNRVPTSLVNVHQMNFCPPRNQLIPLGNDVFVAGPALALAQAARHLSTVDMLRQIYELCGIYAIVPKTQRVQLVARELMEAGAIPAGRSTRPGQGVYGYADEHGKRLPAYDTEGNPLVWQPCIDRHGRPASFWKRPALETVETLVANLDALGDVRGKTVVKRLLKHAIDGSGSPLETDTLLIGCLPPRMGGEHWEHPDLNRRIVFDERAERLAGAPWCYADFLWRKQGSVLEADGAAFHDDRARLLADHERTAALESMGYNVAHITYEEISDLQNLETRLESISKRLELPLQHRTARFIAARHALHRSLFPATSAPVERRTRRTASG